MLKLSAAAGFVAAALIFGVFGDPNSTKLALIAMLVVVSLCVVNKGNWSIGPSGLMLLACLGYFALSILWSLDWREGVNQLVQILPFVVLYLVLSRTDVFAYLPQAAGISIIGAVVLFHYNQEIVGGFGNRNFIAEFLIGILPFALVGLPRGKWALLGSVSTLLGIWFLGFKSPSSIPAFAALFVLLAWSIWLWGKERKFISFVLWLAIANALVWIFFLKGKRIYNSVLARLELTYNTLVLWLDAPIFGNGSGSFNYGYPRHQEDHLLVLPDYSILGDISMYAGAAHNEIAQVLSEQGIAGLAIVQLFALILYRHWREKKRDALDVAAAWSLGLTLWISLIGFPLHNTVTALVAVVAASIIARGERAWLAGCAHTPVAAYTGGIVAVFILGMTFVSAAGNYRLTVARVLLNGPYDALAAFKENVRAYDTWPFDQLVRRQLIMTVAKASMDYKKSLTIEPNAADKIYKISMTAGDSVPSTAIARLDYLVSSNRYETEKEEIEKLFSSLKKSASRLPITWFAETIYALKTGDMNRAVQATKKMIKRKYPNLPEAQIAQKAEEMFKEMAR